MAVHGASSLAPDACSNLVMAPVLGFFFAAPWRLQVPKAPICLDSHRKSFPQLLGSGREASDCLVGTAACTAWWDMGYRLPFLCPSDACSGARA